MPDVKMDECGTCEGCDTWVPLDDLQTVGGLIAVCPACRTQTVLVSRAEWGRLKSRVGVQRRELQRLNDAYTRTTTALRLKVAEQTARADRLLRMFDHAHVLNKAVTQIDADIRALHSTDKRGLCVICHEPMPCRTVALLSPDPEAYLRELHVKHSRRDHCQECGTTWPCHVKRILDRP